MEEPRIVINTTLEKEDYRKFLYIATFRRNKFIIPFLVLISFVGGLLIGIDYDGLSLTRLFLSWILLFFLAIAIVLFKVEKKNKQRIKTDKTGTFDSVNTLKFYDDRVVMENESLKSKGELMYNQFFAVMESKEYFIFYLTMNQASIIRKKDVKDVKELKDFLVEKFQGKYKEI